ncbi:MAG: DUF2079 domain-containing protein [Myxococcaceae bacterium]
MTRARLGLALTIIGASGCLLLFAASCAGGVRVPGLRVTSFEPLRWWALVLAAGLWLRPPKWSAGRVFAGAVAAAVAYSVLYKLGRYYSFNAVAFDLTIFESVLRSELDGRGSHALLLGRSLFSEHFEPVVLLFVPLYRLASSSLTLMLAQALAVPLAAVPLYRAGKALGLLDAPAAVVGGAWLVNAAAWQAHAVDFHPESFAPLFVFWAFDCSLRRRWLRFAIAVALSLSVKEEMALVMACFALLVLRGEGRRWPFALATLAVSVAWGVICFRWVMPAFRPATVDAAGGHVLAWRWAHLGGSFSEMALHVALRPGYLLGLLVTRPALELFGSVGFVALLDPFALVAALPELWAHLASSYGLEAELGSYYGVLPVMLCFPAVLGAVRRVQERAGERLALLVAAVALCAHPRPMMLDRVEGGLAAERAVRAIGEDEPVCVQNAIAPHRTPSLKLRFAPDCGDAKWLITAEKRECFPLDAGQCARLAAQAELVSRDGPVSVWKTPPATAE